MRIRLCWPIINAWSIIHTILFIIQLLVDLLYIWARPEQTLSFFQTISDSTVIQISSFVQWLQDTCPKTIYNGFNPPNDYSAQCNTSQCTAYEVGMWFASYSFLLEAMVELLFTSVACSMFGETEHALIIASTQSHKYKISSVKLISKKESKKSVQETARQENIIPAMQ